MDNLMIIPRKIEQMISGKAFTANEVRMSKAKVMVFDDCVLKIGPYRKKNEKTVEVMLWLEHKLPVPKVLCYEQDAENQYLLMSRVQGKMACDEYYMERPKELVEGLAEGIGMLWSIDCSGCPRSRDIDTELEEAGIRIENHMIDMENASPGTFGKGGFKDPEDLLIWLENNKPGYEPVLSHGDYCLPNVFLDNGRVSGFIDLEDTGIGDRWRDIALCYRSLKGNSDGTYGGKVYPDVKPDMLFDALGIRPDKDKLRYYILLDELY